MTVQTVMNLKLLGGVVIVQMVKRWSSCSSSSSRPWVSRCQTKTTTNRSQPQVRLPIFRTSMSQSFGFLHRDHARQPQRSARGAMREQLVVFVIPFEHWQSLLGLTKGNADIDSARFHHTVNVCHHCLHCGLGATLGASLHCQSMPTAVRRVQCTSI